MAEVLHAHQVCPDFISDEVEQLGEWRVAKTANRSVVGIMNEFSFLGERFADRWPGPPLLPLSLRLSTVPCGPLYKSQVRPDSELAAVLAQWPDGV